jgi:hypothetical protein
MKPDRIKKSLFTLLFVVFLTGCATTHLKQEKGSVSFESLTVIGTDWQVYAQENGIDLQTGISERSVTVLGHYPEYVDLTEQLGVESMQIPMEKWERMNPGRQWRTTVRYLNRQIRNDHHFRLATPIEQARPGSYYVRELQYLSGKGYQLSPDSLWLVR